MRESLAKSAALAITVLLAGAIPAAAQRIPIDTNPNPDELRNIFTLQVENDFFNIFGRSDRDYTNGIRLGWLSPALPDLPDTIANMVTFPTFFGEARPSSVTRRIGISLGQNIYTPQDTATSLPIYNDRPYAGWLYVSFALQQTYKRAKPGTNQEEPLRQDTVALDLGLIGPAAGGEFVQNNFHRLIDDTPAMGWANQLYNEPTFNLTFERRWRVARGVAISDPKLEYDVVPWLGLTAGNVADYISAGGVVRIGKELQNDFGPPRPRPALPGSEGFIGQGFGWYLFAGLGGEAVAHNIFLDGNTGGGSIVAVGHRPFVGQAQAGFTVLFSGVRINFTQVLRTPEFYQRDRYDLFGSISVTFRY